ncbi:MAG: hypothetical protein WA843_01650 [Candidatus Saccharimonadales bacterium]
MSDPESVRTPQPNGELRRYENGSIDQIYQTLGDSLSMGGLVRELQLNPDAHDAGSIAIETESADRTRKTYYFDGLHYLDEKGLLTKTEPLDEASVHNPDYDIRIGQPWRNPFGVTDPVVSIAVPYVGEYFPEDIKVRPANEVSATATGRSLIDQYNLVGQREPVPGMVNPRNN